MGLKNYDEQMNLLNTVNLNNNNLKGDVTSLNNLIAEIDKSWKGSNEKEILINNLEKSVSALVKIVNQYTIFFQNGRKWINELNELEKITKLMTASKGYKIAIYNGKKNSYQQLDYESLLNHAKKLKSISKRLKNIYSSNHGIALRFDPQITGRFSGNYALRDINRRLLIEANCIQKNANNLVKIVDLYKKADKELLRNIQDDSIENLLAAMVEITIQNNISNMNKGLSEGIESKLLEQAKEDLLELIHEDLDDLDGIVEEFKEGDYREGLIEIGDFIGDKLVGDKYKEGKVNWGGLKVKAISTTFKICTDPDGYILKNDEKYRAKMDESFEDGNFLQFLSSMGGNYIQTVGKGTFDVTGELINSALNSTLVGKGLTYLNAACEDAFGVSPGLAFNYVTDKISDGVDNLVDSSIEFCGKIDEGGKALYKAAKNLKKATVKSVKSGLNSAGKFIRSLF